MQFSSTATIGRILQQHGKVSAAIRHLEAIGGGCINQALRITLSDGTRYFLKHNAANHAAMFAAEAAGLQALQATQTLRVPAVLGQGVEQGQAYLLLEYLPLQGNGNPRWAGEGLAVLHRHTAAQFGWQQDNFIGSTPQRNAWHTDWITFWQQERLGAQLAWAKQHGYPARAYTQGLRLLESVAALFDGYRPVPSLLHGDLWSGNLAYLPDGTPVIFDPACYYGDRETDVAMTELFGGFGADFYAAYAAAWPLDAGYRTRKTLYNLYHILNHFNLFGGGYAAQAERMTQRLLSEVRA